MGLQKLKIIGNGDAFGSGNRYHTCFYLQSDKVNSLIDCGSTAIVNLKKLDINLNGIDLILISHFHGDHFGGIPFFLLDSHFALKRDRPLTIIGPEDCESRIQKLVDLLYPGLAEKIWEMDLVFLEYDPVNNIEFGDLKIRAAPVIHAPGSNPHGIRIDSGGTGFGYSGDTEWTESLLGLSEGTDIFICECSYLESDVKGHLNYNLLSQKASSMNSKRIMLTHMSDEVLDKTDQVLMEMTEQDLEYNF